MKTIPPIPLPITNERGEVLVSVHETTEASAVLSGPISVCLMIAQHSCGTVLVHNRRRQVWELPGGFVDAGETLLEGVVRELHEETGCHATSTQLVAVLEIESPHADMPPLRCALYRCKVEAYLAPQDVEEVDGITYWDGKAYLAPVSAIDAALVRAFGLPHALQHIVPADRDGSSACPRAKAHASGR